jgi:hypothetical protein
MSKSRLAAILTFAIFLACSFLPLASAQTSAVVSPEAADRLALMEKQIAELQAQIAALKQTTAPAPATAAAPAAVVTSDAKPASGPLDGFTNVLGGATLTGYVDTFYNVNFSQPASHFSGARSWDNLNNGFELNMVNLALDKPVDKDSRAGYHVSLAFGHQMDVINSSEPVSSIHNKPGWDQYLMEAYFSYLAPVGKGLQFDVGKFVTPMGAEVIPSKDNWNYTRGLLFDYAIPLYHYGVRAKYTFSPKVTLTGFVLNGWNNVIDNNSGKTGAVSLALTPTKKLTITQNYMFGPEQSQPFAGGVATADKHWRQVSDTTIAYAATKKLTLQTNIDYGRDTLDGVKNPVYWTGAANYIRYAFNPKYALTGRYEYYLDHDGFTTGVPQHLNEVTATFERRMVGHIISRLEYRRDMSNQAIFFDHSLSTPTLKNQNTFTVGMVYTLDKTE